MILDGTKQDLIRVLKEKLPNPKAESHLTDYYRDFIQIGGGDQSPRDIYIYPISKEKVDKINRRFVLVMSALVKLARYVVYQDNSLLKVLRIPDLNIEGLKKRNRNFMFSYARIDSIFSGSDYRILEINAKRPQIHEDADWLSSYFKYIFGSELKADNVCRHIARSVRAGFYLNNGRYPEYIVVFSGFMKLLEEKKNGSFFIRAFQSVFPLSEIEAITCEKLDEFYRLLEVKYDQLFYRNKKIDLLVFQDLCSRPERLFTKTGALFNKRIWRAYETRNLEIESPLSSWIVGNKMSLPLISDQDLQGKIGMNDEEKDAVGLILKNYYIRDIEDIEPINKNKYVVKIPEKGGGKGVFVGNRMSKKKFYSLIAGLLEENEGLIFQKKAFFGKDEIINFQTFGEEAAALTLDPFLVNNPEKKDQIQVVGYSSRAIPESKIDRAPIFNPMLGREEIMFGGIIETD